MNPERDRRSLITVLGLAAGAAATAGLWLWRRRRGGQPEPGRPWSPQRGSAQEVADAIRRDAKLAGRTIEVEALAEGVIELGGRVRTRSESDRAVALAQSAAGVYTVVNRLGIEEEESHREATRKRWNDGAADLRERQHYGMGVGMGTRRQSPATDPDRPSEKQRLLERELDVANIEDAPESGPDPISGAEAVENADVKPGDERAIREAGLDASPRPTSTPKRSVDGEEDGEGTEPSAGDAGEAGPAEDAGGGEGRA